MDIRRGLIFVAACLVVAIAIQIDPVQPRIIQAEFLTLMFVLIAAHNDVFNK